MSEAALSAYEELNKILMNKSLNDSTIREMVRNHFEKRLLDAAEEHIFDMDISILDPKNTEKTTSLEIRKKLSSDSLQEYKDLLKQHEFGFEQKAVATKLMQQFLGENEARQEDPNFTKLCREIARAHYEAERIINANLEGDFQNTKIEDPYFKDCKNFLQEPDPELYFKYLSKPFYKKIVTRSISDAFEEYYAAKLKETEFRNKSKNTVEEYRGFAERLYDIWGENRDISSIEKKDVLGLKDMLMSYPKHFKNKFEKHGIDLLSVLKGEHGEYEKISSSQAKKMWDAHKGFFRWALENELIVNNYFEEIIFVAKRHSQADRDPFTKQQLEILFSSALYRGRQYKKSKPWVRSEKPCIKNVYRDGYFWMPLIGLFTGMRSGEILQLVPQDLKKEDGIYYFDLDNVENLKSAQSKRYIPIHPELIKIGLIEHIQKQTQNDDFILNDIPRCKKKISNKYSGKFSRYLAEIGIKTNKNSFHSFRHNFEDAMIMAGVSERSQFALAGHSANRSWTTNHAYGQNNLQKIYQELEKIHFDFLDFSYLYV